MLTLWHTCRYTIIYTYHAVDGSWVRVQPGVYYSPLNQISIVSRTTVHNRKWALLPGMVDISCFNLYKQVITIICNIVMTITVELSAVGDGVTLTV